MKSDSSGQYQHEVWPEDHEKSTKNRTFGWRGPPDPGAGVRSAPRAHAATSHAAALKNPTKFRGARAIANAASIRSAATAPHDSRPSYPGHRPGHREGWLRAPRSGSAQR